jgi:D-arabinose 1-dehydrogenase-like Zn-dependent alcohol dehydrogenase
MMRALRLPRIGTSPVVDLIDVPAPSANEVLIRVHAAGICGSDHHIIAGHNPLPEYPRTLGHEMAGEVTALGSDVRGVEVGDRVAVNFLISCGSCDYCLAGRTSLCVGRLGLGVALDGGLADYVVVPSANVIGIPGSVPYAHAAIATDAFATPLHAIRRSALQPGDRCLVLGAGGLGLSAIQLLSALGAGEILAIDVDPAALDAAIRAGATTVNTSDELSEMNSAGVSLLVRHAFDFVGSPQTVASAIENTARGGRINVVGLTDKPIELVRGDILVREEKIIAGSYSFDNNEIREVLDLMSRGLIDPDSVIGDRISLDPAPNVLNPAGNGRRGFGRTVVELDPASLLQTQIHP